MCIYVDDKNVVSRTELDNVLKRERHGNMLRKGKEAVGTDELLTV